MTLPNDSYDAIIIGGGPAGSSAAIHLANRGVRVLLAEQKKFPRAKLCGEFISPECLDHFVRLGVMSQIELAEGAAITETVFYASNGRNVSIPSQWFGGRRVAALGLSRSEMDARLLTRARQVGVEVREETHASNLVIDSDRACGVELRSANGDIRIEHAPITMDATGRARSIARRVEKNDRSAKRQRQSRFVAFKAHLTGARGAPDRCEIYVYRGGYGGLNSIENGMSNICFIAAARDVRRLGGDAERVMREVVERNQRARWTLANAKNVSPWLAVALDGFGRRSLVPADGLLTIGDAASFIDPFTGSGMLMAMESGELAAVSLTKYLPRLRHRETFQLLANDYRASYDARFRSRLRVSAVLRRVAFMPRIAEATIFTVGASDRIRRRLARSTRTHVDEISVGVR